MSIYGLSDMKVINEIVSACSKLFFEFGGKMNVSIDVFRVTKQEQLSMLFWQTITPYLVIEFRGEE